MKTFKLFESMIIGLLFGVVVSIYILFMDTAGRDIGYILKTISLTHVIDYVPLPYKDSILFDFLFYILVYIVYIVVLNFIFKIHKKIAIGISIILILLAAVSTIQQVNALKEPVVLSEPVVEVGMLTSQNIKKYFGEEVKGDLNKDNLDDIAFLIKRNEEDERGDMYYLSASLKIDDGYKGLNLLYIGENITIQTLQIQESVIIIYYTEESSDEVKEYKAIVQDNKLNELKQEEIIEQIVSE